VQGGERFPARFGRQGFRRNFPFEGIWLGRSYRSKQLENLCRAEKPELAGHHGDRQVFLRSETIPMKLTYDPRANVAYLRLCDRTEQVETLKISDELNIDLAPDGTVYGIELLNANDQLRAADGGRFVIFNEAKGQEQAVALEG
jgi:uncharacterized protein YuzE